MNLKSPPKIQRILENHIASIHAQQSEWQRSGQMEHLLTRLVEGEPIAFTVAAIEQNLAASIATRTHREQRGLVSDVYLTVSAIPAVDAADIRRFFPSGYRTFFSLSVLRGDASWTERRPFCFRLAQRLGMCYTFLSREIKFTGELRRGKSYHTAHERSGTACSILYSAVWYTDVGMVTKFSDTIPWSPGTRSAFFR